MFCETLRSLRLSKKLSQRALAEAIYVSPSAISQYEKGRTRPSRDNLEAIAKFFNVSTDYLLGTSAIADLEEQMNQSFCRDVTVSGFLSKCMRVDEKYRNSLLNVVDALAAYSTDK